MPYCVSPPPVLSAFLKTQHTITVTSLLEVHGCLWYSSELTSLLSLTHSRTSEPWISQTFLEHHYWLNCDSIFPEGLISCAHSRTAFLNHYSFSQLLKHYNQAFELKLLNHNAIFQKAHPFCWTINTIPLLCHESDLVNCYCKTLHTNPYISQCLHHVVI